MAFLVFAHVDTCHGVSSSNKYSARLSPVRFFQLLSFQGKGRFPQVFSCPAVQRDSAYRVTDGFDGFSLAYDTMVKFLLDVIVFAFTL
jgi:hypothetical protein